MIWGKLLAIRTELKSFTLNERLFVLCAMLCSFLISSDYSIIRPVSNAVFITAYSSAMFPYAWLAVVPLNFLIVTLYNKYLPKLGCFKMFLSVAGIVSCISLFSALFLKKIEWLPFFFYIWKEVYIMLMFQLLWSVIHNETHLSRAKYLYGILFGIGALGSMTGSLIPSFLAVRMGSENLLFANLPIYLLLGAAYFFLLKNTSGGLHLRVEKKQPSVNTLKHGIQLITQSKFLIFILSIVIFMQVSSSLVDFQFNHFLEKTIGDKDLRTQYTGRVMAIVHMATLSLQFLGSFLLVHFLGIRRSHYLIPLLLCINSIGFLFFPAFAMISFSFITIKCFDFSLFTVIKEMLYIPLGQDEKFRAKSLIDVFAHRTSKALASFLILGLQLFAIAEIQPILSWIGIGIFGTWCAVAMRMLKDSQAVLTKQI